MKSRDKKLWNKKKNRSLLTVDPEELGYGDFLMRLSEYAPLFSAIGILYICDSDSLLLVIFIIPVSLLDLFFLWKKILRKSVSQ